MTYEEIEKIYEDLENRGCNVYNKGKMYNVLSDMSGEDLDKLMVMFEEHGTMLLYSSTEDSFVVFIP